MLTILRQLKRSWKRNTPSKTWNKPLFEDKEINLYFQKGSNLTDFFNTLSVYQKKSSKLLQHKLFCTIWFYCLILHTFNVCWIHCWNSTFQLNSSNVFQTHLLELGTNSWNQHVHHVVMSEPDHWISQIFLNRSTQAMIMLKESLDGRTSFSHNSLSHVR